MNDRFENGQSLRIGKDDFPQARADIAQQAQGFDSPSAHPGLAGRRSSRGGGCLGQFQQAVAAEFFRQEEVREDDDRDPSGAL